MVSSMTGFGTATQIFQTSKGKIEISVELRTLNSKYLDVQIRSPRTFMIFDSEIEKCVRQKLYRGRVDVMVTVRMMEGMTKEISVNRVQAESTFKLLSQLANMLGLAEKVSLAHLLKLPDWLEVKESSLSPEEGKFLKEAVGKALIQVLEARAKEGEALKNILISHRKMFETIFKNIVSHQEAMLKALRARLKERIHELYGKEGFDPVRLEQEIVLGTMRSDFQEEKDRIVHHLQTFDQMIQLPSEVGRKLEFLVQELLREVNTLGAKCPDASLMPQIIDLKTYIERMREQIQNIE